MCGDTKMTTDQESSMQGAGWHLQQLGGDTFSNEVSLKMWLWSPDVGWGPVNCQSLQPRPQIGWHTPFLYWPWWSPSLLGETIQWHCYYTYWCPHDDHQLILVEQFSGAELLRSCLHDHPVERWSVLMNWNNTSQAWYGIALYQLRTTMSNISKLQNKWSQFW